MAGPEHVNIVTTGRATDAYITPEYITSSILLVGRSCLNDKIVENDKIQTRIVVIKITTGAYRANPFKTN